MGDLAVALPMHHHWLPQTIGFPCSSVGKERACNGGDRGSIRGSGRSPGEGNGYRLQYSGLENSMECIVRGVAKSQTVTKRVGPLQSFC